MKFSTQSIDRRLADSYNFLRGMSSGDDLEAGELGQESTHCIDQSSGKISIPADPSKWHRSREQESGARLLKYSLDHTADYNKHSTGFRIDVHSSQFKHSSASLAPELPAQPWHCQFQQSAPSTQPVTGWLEIPVSSSYLK